LEGAKTQAPQEDGREHPGHVKSHIGGSPVYQETGVMPDEISSWIQTEKVTRRLQYSELAKAKAITEVTTDYTSNGARAAIQDGTSIHIWMATLDTIADWLQARSKIGEKEASQLPTQKTTECEGAKRGPSPSTWHDDDPGDAEETWEWHAPDLSKGSQWYKEQIKAKGETKAEDWYPEGLQALATRQENYTKAGPKRLQLLWWEFPEEHWEALQEGSSMNFLIS
jgi:hypothetical protein